MTEMAQAQEELASIAGEISPGSSFRIALPAFEGPLDLLLHLIKEHQLDVLDIPIALVTEKYIEYLQLMKELNLDIAGEFLLMAATLAHIKSRMLLPQPEPQGEEQEEQGDPREELVRRLLTYQKFKDAARKLGEMPLLGRDMFARRVPQEKVAPPEGDLGLVEISVFKLIELFDHVLKKAKISIPHEVIADRLSISDAISTVTERLTTRDRLGFREIFQGATEKRKVVVTFLALLEMAKLKLIRVYQADSGGEIFISTASTEMAAVSEIRDDYR